MFLFRMHVTITYPTSEPNEIDILYKHTDLLFRTIGEPLGYTIEWENCRLRVPTESMDQAVTESDSFVVERKFLQYKNVYTSRKIFSGIIELLGSLGELGVSYNMEQVKILPK